MSALFVQRIRAGAPVWYGEGWTDREDLVDDMLAGLLPDPVDVIEADLDSPVPQWGGPYGMKFAVCTSIGDQIARAIYRTAQAKRIPIPECLHAFMERHYALL
jgi:hypothetical protein